MHVSLLLFEAADLLDVGGPYEVFLTASRLAQRDGLPAPFAVDTVTLDGQLVTAYGGLGLTPSAPADVLERTDLLIVPGTIDIQTAVADEALSTAISTVAARGETTVASVCTGAFLLAEAGLLDQRSWTTHWEDIDDLTKKLDPNGAQRGVRWVDQGTVVTSGGLSSGIAMALHLVSRFASQELAERTANQIDYVWTESTNR